jgi:hypothetical protein
MIILETMLIFMGDIGIRTVPLYLPYQILQLLILIKEKEIWLKKKGLINSDNKAFPPCVLSPLVLRTQHTMGRKIFY